MLGGEDFDNLIVDVRQIYFFNYYYYYSIFIVLVSTFNFSHTNFVTGVNSIIFIYWTFKLLLYTEGDRK